MKASKKKAQEWERAYGSYERVWWMRGQNCEVCGRLPSQNAHVKNGGMGRKADAKWIVPLCTAHHQLLHSKGQDTFQREYDIDLEQRAKLWQERWQAHQKGDTDLGF